MKPKQRTRTTKTATFSARPELMDLARKKAKSQFQSLSAYICALVVKDTKKEAA